MDSGTPIEIEALLPPRVRKTVMVARVGRGRVSVRWPFVGEFDVDLINGELVHRPVPSFGVFTVDTMTGRIIDTRSCIASEDLPLLEEISIGATLRLDCGITADVVDVLHSEGTIRIFVQGEQGVPSRHWRTGYRVRSGTLLQLREAAGCVSAPALAS
jgi:hypothetical protein